MSEKKNIRIDVYNKKLSPFSINRKEPKNGENKPANVNTAYKIDVFELEFFSFWFVPMNVYRDET